MNELYAGLIGVLFFLIIWCTLFIYVAHYRKQILYTSIVFGTIGPVLEYWHKKDYWHPVYFFEFSFGSHSFGLEDFLFAFGFSGICVSLFYLFSQSSAPNLTKKMEQYNASGIINLIILCLINLTLTGILIHWLDFNSVYAFSLSCVIGAFFLLRKVTSWVVPALQTSIIMIVMMWLFYGTFFLELFPGIIERWWKVNELSGVQIAGVPLEELIWAGAVAIVLGPIVRFCMGFKQ